MNRLSKFAAMLTAWIVVTTPTPVLFAHSGCIAGFKNSEYSCHPMAVRQACSIHQMQVADGSCCQLEPALPSKAVAYAAASPTATLAVLGYSPSNLRLRVTHALPTDLLRRSLHCRSQAILCTFLI